MNQYEKMYSISQLERSAEKLSRTLENAMLIVCRKRLGLARKRLDGNENGNIKSTELLEKTNIQEEQIKSTTQESMSRNISWSNKHDNNEHIKDRSQSRMTSLQDIRRIAQKIKMYRQRKLLTEMENVNERFQG